MVIASNILSYVDRIVRHAKPERVMLFGSYAYGTPTADSDVDLLVIKNRAPSGTDVTLRMKSGDAGFPLDLLVRTPKDIARRIRENDFFLAEIMKKGITLYASDDEGVGRKGRDRLRRRLRAAQVSEVVSA